MYRGYLRVVSKRPDVILSAQRVRATSGAQRVNCYHYVHGQVSIASPVELYCLKATLVWEHRPLPRPGNRVRSWVDVAAPDGSAWEEIFAVLEVMLALPVIPQAFSPIDSHVAFTLHMDPALRPHWQQEVLLLLSHLNDVHP